MAESGTSFDEDECVDFLPSPRQKHTNRPSLQQLLSSHRHQFGKLDPDSHEHLPYVTLPTGAKCALLTRSHLLAECDPISAAWNPYFGGNVHCIPLLTEFICASPVNVVTDLALLALPLATLAKSQLHVPVLGPVSSFCKGITANSAYSALTNKTESHSDPHLQPWYIRYVLRH